MQGCTGIVLGPSSATSDAGVFACYRKAHIMVKFCDQNTEQFDTYVKREWLEADGFNCFGPRGDNTFHGAWDLETPIDSSCGTMNLADC